MIVKANIFILIAAIVLLGVTLNLYFLRPPQPDRHASSLPPTTMPFPVVRESHLTFAVVPRGLHSIQELRQRYDSDAQFRALLGDVDWPKIAEKKLTEDTCFYSSFRRAGIVLWTGLPSLCLKKGEKIFTDGNVIVRAACGNRLSLLPQQPYDLEVTGETLDTPEYTEPPVISLSEPVTPVDPGQPPSTPPTEFFPPSLISCTAVSTPEPSVVDLIFAGVFILGGFALLGFFQKWRKK